MRIFALCCLMFLCSSFTFAGNPLKVSTIDGDVVLVDKDEITRAWNEARSGYSNNYESILLNDDGSVTIIMPRFQYGGKNYPVISSENGIWGKATGVCKLFGFSEFHYSEVGYDHGYIAFINSEGHLSNTIKGGLFISQLTCSEEYPLKK